MKVYKNRVIVMLIAALVINIILPSQSISAKVREADVKKASKGCTFVGLEGKYEKVAKAKILKKVNKIRKEACDKGYINPDNGEKLTSADYTPVKWSESLELIAQLRAAECTVNQSHTRPNGRDCFTIVYNDEHSWGECLAWNNDGIMKGIDQWYAEKKDWVKQNKKAVTGHYTNMISPNTKYIGLGGFVRLEGGWHGIAGEFSSMSSSGEKQNGLKGKVVQKIDVKNNKLSKNIIDGKATVKKGKKSSYRLIRTATYPGIMSGKNRSKVIVLGTIKWKTSDKKIAVIDKNGKLTAKKAGKTKIKAVLPNGKSVSKTIEVQ